MRNLVHSLGLCVEGSRWRQVVGVLAMLADGVRPFRWLKRRAREVGNVITECEGWYHCDSAFKGCSCYLSPYCCFSFQFNLRTYCIRIRSFSVSSTEMDNLSFAFHQTSKFEPWSKYSPNALVAGLYFYSINQISFTCCCTYSALIEIEFQVVEKNILKALENSS